MLTPPVLLRPPAALPALLVEAPPVAALPPLELPALLFVPALLSVFEKLDPPPHAETAKATVTHHDPEIPSFNPTITLSLPTRYELADDSAARGGFTYGLRVPSNPGMHAVRLFILR